MYEGPFAKLERACADDKAVLAVFGPPDYSECPELRPVVMPSPAPPAPRSIQQIAADYEPLVIARAAEKVRATEREGWAILPPSCSSISPAAVLI